MLSILRRLMKSENGVTAIEYTLIVSLIAGATIVALQEVVDGMTNTLNNLADVLN